MSRCLAALVVVLALTGCDRKHSDAVVVEKEHIAAREPTPTPTVAPPAAESATRAPEAEPELREMAPDEIEVDGVVMKKVLRGTSRDPRAAADERWLVKVQTTAGRTFNVPADQTRFEKLRVGDRVQIVYRVGKYTGTVWAADFE
jgi:uncharacterized lipoprotein NlpE involved in copper resistance